MCGSARLSQGDQADRGVDARSDEGSGEHPVGANKEGPGEKRAQSPLSEVNRNPVESTRYTASATLLARLRSQRPISSHSSPVKTAQERLALASAKVERDNSLAPR